MIPLAFRDLFVSVTDAGPDDPLANWRWLVGRRARPLFLTAMGDLFVVRPTWLLRREQVFFLDAMGGTFERAARSLEELREQLRRAEVSNAWLLPDLVAELRENGIALTEGQCYSPKLLPVLGGRLETDNFFPNDWRKHLGFTGHIHEQLRDVPDGEQVQFEWLP